MSGWNFMNLGASTRPENKKHIEKIFEYLGITLRPAWSAGAYDKCSFSAPDVYGCYSSDYEAETIKAKSNFDFSVQPDDLMYTLNALFPKTSIYIHTSEGTTVSDTYVFDDTIYDTQDMTMYSKTIYEDEGGYGPNGHKYWKARFALETPRKEFVEELLSVSQADGNKELSALLEELLRKLEAGLITYEADSSDIREIGKRYDIEVVGDVDDYDDEDDNDDEDDEEEDEEDEEEANNKKKKEDNKSAFAIRNGVLTRYKGHDKHVVIPDGVVEIVDLAFEYCSLTSVKMPDSVKYVDDGAFRDYEGMEQMWLPSHPEYIGSASFDLEIKEMHYPGDFESWLALDKSEWPDSPLVAAEEFYCNGKRITEYSIPEGTERIEDKAFKECHVLEKITIPNSVTSIGKYAFAYIGSLKEIIIPDSVKEIGKGAFYCCENLTKAIVPKALKEMVQANNVFGDCEALTDIQYV